MTDVEIAGTLSATLIGAVAFLSLYESLPQGLFRKIARISMGPVLGLATGLIAVRLTEPLDGCSIVRLKDSDLHLVWGTDGVMVRTVAICGLAGTFLGALAQATHSTLRSGVGSAILTSVLLGFLGGALLVGLPATFLVTIVRTMKGVPFP